MAQLQGRHLPLSAALPYGSRAVQGADGDMGREDQSELELLQEDTWVYALVDAPALMSRVPGEPAEGFAVLGTSHAVLVAYTGDEPCVDIPDCLDGRPVREVYNRAFEGNVALRRVRMPNTVVKMGVRVFAQCRELEAVWLSDALVDVDDTVFSQCASLHDLHLPASLRRFGKRLVEGCPLEVLSLGAALEEFSWSYNSSDTLRRLEVDPANEHFGTDGLALFTKDGTELLQMVVGVPEYRVPEGCRRIHAGAFKAMTRLSGLDLGTTVEVIEPYAFYLTSLRSLALPPSLEDVQDHAFSLCRYLASVVFSEGLASVGAAAFAKTSVTEVQLPSTLRVLGPGAFSPASPLSTEPLHLEIAPGNPWLATDGHALYRRAEDGLWLSAVLDVPERYEVLDGCVGVDAHAFRRNPVIEEVVFPVGLRVIGDAALEGCANLRHAKLPASLVSIGAAAFFETSLSAAALGPAVRHVGARAFAKVDSWPGSKPHAISSIEVAAENPCFYTEGNLLVERCADGAGRAICFFGRCTDLVFPPSVGAIDDLCFYHARIGRLVLPARLDRLAPEAFRGLNGVTRVLVPCPDGGSPLELVFPDGAASAEGICRSVQLGEDGFPFSFEAYDAWAVQYGRSRGADAATATAMALARLEHPCRLGTQARHAYEELVRELRLSVCVASARLRDFGLVDRLQECGLFDAEALDEVISAVGREDDTEALAYLMDMKSRAFGFARHDFSL